MTVAEMKQRVLEAIDRQAERIVEIGHDIFTHPELGYKETRSAQRVAEVLREMGLEPETGLAITGVRADIVPENPQVSLAILGELDAVVCPEHPHADPETGASHSCGHNGQIAAMLGAGMGLLESGVWEQLGGQVVLFAVPAEEFVELEYRQKLRDEGKIRFFGGKQELIARGHFDDIDLAMQIHLAALPQQYTCMLGGTSNGFIGKLIRYIGKEAHAGGAPHLGVNALNAAMLGIQAIHAQRETFRDEDTVRVHPIITRGGDLVNIIPADVRLETYVRGKTMEAILDASQKVNRALRAGAMAVGAEVEITELPGYLPRLNDPAMNELFRENLSALVPAESILPPSHTTGSSDMGDINHLLPSIHPYVGGAVGKGHSKEFEVTDPQLAYVTSAKALALTAIDLLADEARRALEIKRAFKPIYTKESYLAMWEKLFQG
ncbi:MAG: amidohydrolase [Bacillota bacterium]